MNIEMDKKAKGKVKSYIMQSKRLTKIPEELWACCIHGHKLVKNIDKQLREHMHNAETTEYWKKKQQIRDPAVEINWESLGRAMEESTPAQCCWVCKLAMGFFAHEKHTKMENTLAATCLRCRIEVEDKEHVFKCPHPTAEIQWEKSLTTLQNWMVLSNTEPMLRCTILSCLRKWRTEPTGTEVQEPGRYRTHTR